MLVKLSLVLWLVSTGSIGGFWFWLLHNIITEVHKVFTWNLGLTWFDWRKYKTLRFLFFDCLIIGAWDKIAILAKLGGLITRFFVIWSFYSRARLKWWQRRLKYTKLEFPTLLTLEFAASEAEQKVLCSFPLFWALYCSTIPLDNSAICKITIKLVKFNKILPVSLCPVGMYSQGTLYSRKSGPAQQVPSSGSCPCEPSWISSWVPTDVWVHDMTWTFQFRPQRELILL